ncbi:MAG: GspE/PulE family protein [Pseudomonadota bacterium]
MPTKSVNPQHEKPLTLRLLLGYLMEDSLIDLVQHNHLLGEAEKLKKGEHPVISIAGMNWESKTTPPHPLTAERLTRWLAERFDIPYIHIDPLKTDFYTLTQFVSYAYASRFNILPVKSDENSVTIATAEPNIREWEPDLAQVLNKDIHRVIANPQDISHYLNEFYGLQSSIRGVGQNTQASENKINNFEQLLELGKRSGELDAGDQHIVHIVDWLLQYAFQQRASDIHLEPRRETGRIRFRIDGVLHLVHEVPVTVLAAMTSRIKILGRMDLTERRKPQDGRIKTMAPETGKTVELRLSTMPTAFGEKVVMRIFDPEVLVKTVEQLGFSKRDVTLWDKMVTRPHGLILVTGPTGSGKTSTLYSALKGLAKPEINVCTIEDPIEMVEPLLNQMQVQHGIGLDFASGVRTLLRQDPDIIMVGEIRDQETAEVSIQAALTGHLVFSTLHTNDAPSALTRMINIGAPSYLISASLLGVMAQRLVRTLCPHCKTKVPMDAYKWQALITPMKMRMPSKMGQPVGCNECRHTGFLGRTGLFEIMPFTETLGSLLHESNDLIKLRRQALKEGLCPLRISGAQKIAAGTTTFEEVFQVVAINPEMNPAEG